MQLDHTNNAIKAMATGNANLFLHGSANGYVETVSPLLAMAGTSLLPPIVLQAGTLLSTALSGAMEWNGANLYVTQDSGQIRKTVAFTDYVDGSILTAIGSLTSQYLALDGSATMTGQVVGHGNNTASLPAYTFAANSNTGMYRSAANTLSFSTNGSGRLSISTTTVSSTIPIRTSNGSASTPSFSFTSDTNTGIYYPNVADTLCLVTGGTDTLRLTTTTATLSANSFITTSTTVIAQLVATAGAAGWEIGSNTVSYIDLKVPASNDYDMRMLYDGTSGLLSCLGQMTVSSEGGALLFRSHGADRGGFTAAGVFSITGQIKSSGRTVAYGGVQFSDTGGGNHSFKLGWETDSSRVPIYVDDIGVGNLVVGSNVVGAQAADWGGKWSLVVRQTDNANIVFFVDALSDARLKQNIAPTSIDALAAIESVEVVQFDWTAEGAEKAHIPVSGMHADIGLIAQQVEVHMPEVVAIPTVEQDPEQVRRLNEGRALPYLIRAIQQLSERVRQLEADKE